jgi:hypothetical protein
VKAGGYPPQIEKQIFNQTPCAAFLSPTKRQTRRRTLATHQGERLATRRTAFAGAIRKTGTGIARATNAQHSVSERALRAGFIVHSFKQCR